MDQLSILLVIIKIDHDFSIDFDLEMFYEALTKKKYQCYLNSDIALPMIYIDDAITGTLGIIEADDAKLTDRTYNIQSCSFSPSQLADAIKKSIFSILLLK